MPTKIVNIPISAVSVPAGTASPAAVKVTALDGGTQVFSVNAPLPNPTQTAAGFLPVSVTVPGGGNYNVRSVDVAADLVTELAAPNVQTVHFDADIQIIAPTPT